MPQFESRIECTIINFSLNWPNISSIDHSKASPGKTIPVKLVSASQWLLKLPFKCFHNISLFRIHNGAINAFFWRPSEADSIFRLSPSFKATPFQFSIYSIPAGKVDFWGQSNEKFTSLQLRRLRFSQVLLKSQSCQVFLKEIVKGINKQKTLASTYLFV